MMGSGIALITTGGAGGIAKCLRLLDALDIPSVALVDLDYAFRQAVKSGLLAADDADVTSFKAIVLELKDSLGIVVENDDLPKKGGGFTAAEAFCLVARDPRAQQCIGKLAAKLRGFGLWLWERGAIEEHLGLPGKGEEVWSEYRMRLRSSQLEDVVRDLHGVQSMMEWMQTASVRSGAVLQE